MSNKIDQQPGSADSLPETTKTTEPNEEIVNSTSETHTKISETMSTEVIREKINQIFEMDGCEWPNKDDAISHYIEEFHGEEYAPLRSCQVLMVDDHPSELRNHMPQLLAATNGAATFIHYESEKSSIEDLVQRIIEQNPEIVLMDQKLDYYHNVLGIDVTRKLIQQGFTGTIIGFSSDYGLYEIFKRAGAVGALVKSELCIKKNLMQIATMLKKSEKETLGV